MSNFTILYQPLRYKNSYFNCEWSEFEWKNGHFLWKTVIFVAFFIRIRYFWLKNNAKSVILHRKMFFPFGSTHFWNKSWEPIMILWCWWDLNLDVLPNWYPGKDIINRNAQLKSLNTEDGTSDYLISFPDLVNYANQRFFIIFNFQSIIFPQKDQF